MRLPVAYHISGTIHYVIVSYGTHVCVWEGGGATGGGVKKQKIALNEK